MADGIRRTKARLMGATVLLCLLTATAAQPFDTVTFDVSGASGALAKELRAASVLIAAERAKTVTAEDVFASARAEYGALINALYARGYYAPVIHVLLDGREAGDIAPLDAPTTIGTVRVTVDPGPLFRFSTAEVAPLAKGTRLPLGFAPGQVAESGLVLQAVTAGVDGWRGQGFAKTAVAAQTVVADHAKARLAAKVVLDPGPKLRFGALTIVGAERMRPARVREIAGLPEGKLYSPAEMDKATARLRRSGVFKSAVLSEDQAITAPDLLGITANLVENKRRHFSFGAEVASTDGLGLTGDWMHRNLLGGGENLTIDGAITNIGVKQGGVDYALGATITRPATFNADTTWSFGVAAGLTNDVDYTMKSGQMQSSLKRIFSNSLNASVGLSYLYADVTDPGGKTVYQALALPLDVVWDRRDNAMEASRNGYAAAEVKPFLGFGATASGLRVTLDMRGYKALGAQRRLVLAARLQLGSVMGASLAGTPTDYLFYSGGGGSVRGQPYQSLGVYERTDAGGVPYKTGGRQFLAGSFEARMRISDSIGLVGFVDAGRVDANGFFSQKGNYQAGAGVGLRYATPIGPIRFDVAMPVAGKTGAGLQIYVGLGQAF